MKGTDVLVEMREQNRGYRQTSFAPHHAPPRSNSCYSSEAATEGSISASSKLPLSSASPLQTLRKPTSINSEWAIPSVPVCITNELGPCSAGQHLGENFGSRECDTLTSVSSTRTSSLQPLLPRGSTYEPVPAGRMRHGSLGYGLPQPSKRPAIKPHIPLHQTSTSEFTQTIVLAIVGTTGCGKSTVIRKGLSQYKLSETIAPMESSHSLRLPRCTKSDFAFRYPVIDSALDKHWSSLLTVDLPTSSISPAATSQPAIIDSIEVEASPAANHLLPWPQGLPSIDGLIICYDRSNKSSFEPVEMILKSYQSTHLPIMVLGCKSDLRSEVDSNDSLRILKRYDAGLVEVSNQSEDGKAKMRQSFLYMFKAVAKQRASNKQDDIRNPAAPPPLHRVGAPWTDFESNVPSNSRLIPSANGSSSPSERTVTPQHTNPSVFVIRPPVWPQSSNDDAINAPVSLGSKQLLTATSEDTYADSYKASPPHIDDIIRPAAAERKPTKEPSPAQWADLDSLLNKLLFLAVSGEEPSFITNFLLTYRRFTTPRTVLLAMQKRMRQLDNSSGDPTFACFAQMRICCLLETWIRDYAHDFSVPGASGALTALIKSTIAKTHLLHYGSELLPLLERLPNLKDRDTAWAKKAEIIENNGDESDVEDDETRVGDTESIDAEQDALPPSASPKVSFPARERKHSIPLLKIMAIPPQIDGQPQSRQGQPPKQQLKELVKLAKEVLNSDSTEIAQQITRTGVRLFLAIQPRDWLHYTFVSGKKTQSEPITVFNTMSNHLADWVVSLILCHERPKYRVQQIEKFVQIAQKLRQMNNYSALRAFVAGINNATDDPTMEHFKSKSPEASKNLMSWDVLLQQARAHRAYRLALRSSKGACIPALEVHMTDLIRAHEGNGDFNPAYPTKIHWGKFNMMGRFIASTLQCQAQCRNSHDYDFPESPTISNLFVKATLMSTEMQKSRLKFQDFDYHQEFPHAQPKDAAGLRRLLFW